MMDMDEMLKEMIEKQAKETIEVSVDDYIGSVDIDKAIDDVISDKLDEKFCKDDERLEDYIVKSIGKDMFMWFENNLSHEDMWDCMKQALIEKLKDFSLNELVELINRVNKRGI